MSHDMDMKKKKVESLTSGSNRMTEQEEIPGFLADPEMGEQEAPLNVREIRLSVRVKLALAFGVMIFFFVAASLMAISRLNSIHQRLVSIVDVSLVRQILAIEMEQDLLKLHRAQKNLLLEVDAQNMEQEIREINRLDQGLTERMERLEPILLEAGRRDLENFKRLYEQWRVLNNKLIQLVRVEDSGVSREEAIKISRNEVKVIGEQAEKFMSAIEMRNQKIMTEDKKASSADYFLARNVLITLLVLGGILITGLFILLSKGLVDPILRVAANVKKVAQSKDLTQKVEVKSQDEVGVLCDLFNMMCQNLYKVVARIQQASLKVHSSSNEILATATQHEATSTEQSTQMNEIQATLNEAAATATQLNQNAQEIVRFNKEIADQAEEGTRFVEETRTKITALNESNQTVGTKLRALNEKIEGIGKILATIVSVSDQTNLLSLNAAIEAAKAGEHGKGFGVVAQEIRRLADRTSQSSQEISDVVNEIQAASSSAIMVMDKSSQDVEESTRVVRDLAGRFSGISEKVQEILPQTEQISSSITELATGNKQIANSVSEMNKALKLTVDAAKHLKQAAYDLTSMGQQLRSSVGQFKLK